MNGIDNCSFVYAKRVMRLELAELNEMMRLGAGIPGDEYRIGIITGILGRWHMNVPVINHAVEEHFQTPHGDSKGLLQAQL
jgi:hypothetical protein